MILRIFSSTDKGVDRTHYFYKEDQVLGVDAETQYRIFLEKQPAIALRVSMKDIASYLGITPQSLSRIRRNIH